MVLITAAIEVTEGRNVAVIDAPGALLTADMDEEVIVILENEMANAMLEIDMEMYERYVIYGVNEKTHVHLPRKGDVRNAEGRNFVLQKFDKRSKKI